MLKTTRLLATAAAITFIATNAHAGLIVSGSVGGAPVGATNYVTFNSLALGNAGGTSGGITVSFGGNAQTVIGNASGQYAAPFLSSGNGALFGTGDGADTTRYLSTGTGSVTLQLPSMMQYFGMLWGSVDSYNFLDFYSGATLIDTIDGSEVTASPNGNQGVNGTLYVNITSDTPFDRVVARSTSFAFEFDNVAYFTGPSPAVDPVPVPATALLFGASIVGLIASRRRA